MISYISNNKLILFDGKCKLCNAWCRFVIKYDTEHLFKLVSMQSGKGQEILNNLNLPTEYFKTMIVINNNQAYFKSAAFLIVVNQLSFPAKFLFIFKLIPNFLRDFIYQHIAHNRYKIFGKYDQCMMPSADHKGRYL